MALTAGNVQITESGFVFVAPTATAGPTDYTTALDAGFVDLGYLASGGLTEDAPIESKDITVFQNGEVIHSICRTPKVSFGFGLIEHNKAAVQTLVWPGSTLSDTNKTLVYNDHDGGKQVSIVVVELNAGGLGVRTYYPRCKITRRDQVAITNDNEKVYGVGFTAYTNGTFVFKKFHETALAS